VLQVKIATGTPLARLMTYGYDQYGQLTRVTRRFSATAVDAARDATSTYTYDAYGNLSTATDAENQVSRMLEHVT
jgi:YD repeat-containing protein